MHARALVVAASMLVFSFAASSTHATLIQQGGKLVGTGAVNAAKQGHSVAVSGDGNTLLVGALSDNTGAGAVWVFTLSGGMWTQQGPKLVGTGAVGTAMRGASVALSADGNTAVVGGLNDNGGAGAVWVFTRSGTVWSQQGTKLVGTGAVGAASQGITVAVSGDGNTLVEGGCDDNGGVGAVWVFTRSGTVWSQQGTKLVGTGAVGGARQGRFVAVSGDGNTAVEGGFFDNGGAGAAWVFTRSGTVWSQQGPKLVGTDVVGAAQQGISVALSGDGNTAAVGGLTDNSAAGAVWVFTRSGTVWSQQGTKLVGTDAVGPAQQGISVAVSGDGNTLVEGGLLDNGQAGATWVFTRSGGVWSQQGLKLVGTGAADPARQGHSVALSPDANIAVVGASRDNNFAGAAWVFANPSIPIPSLTEWGMLALGISLATAGLLGLRLRRAFV